MNEKVMRALVYILMVGCLLLGTAVVWQSNLIHKQQILIRILYDEWKLNH